MQKDILDLIAKHNRFYDRPSEQMIQEKEINDTWKGYTLQQKHFYYIMPEYEKIIKHYVKPNPMLDLMEEV